MLTVFGPKTGDPLRTVLILDRRYPPKTADLRPKTGGFVRHNPKKQSSSLLWWMGECNFHYYLYIFFYWKLCFSGIMRAFLQAGAQVPMPTGPPSAPLLNLNVDAGQRVIARGGMFHCGECNKAFRQESACWNHVHKHSGGTTCPFCNHTFSRLSSLKKHMANKCTRWINRFFL